MIPPHILGMHSRATERCHAAHRRWKRCLHFHGRLAFMRSSRLARRANMHARDEVRWMKRLNVIVPYVREEEWVPVSWPDSPPSAPSA